MCVEFSGLVRATMAPLGKLKIGPSRHTAGNYLNI